jgi:hypothetical protein
VGGWICPIVSEVDASTFSFLYSPDGSGPFYAKDLNHVYVCCDIDGADILPNADPATFQILTSNPTDYVKDKNHVWWDYTVVEFADPATFVRLPYGVYAKDKNHVFWAGAIIPAADPASFGFYSDGVYAYDGSHVYIDGAAVPNANPNTFVDLGNGYGRDGSQEYDDGAPVSQ